MVIWGKEAGRGFWGPGHVLALHVNGGYMSGFTLGPFTKLYTVTWADIIH